MALPRKLKQMNLFSDGQSWIGIAEEFTPAKLTRKTEPYRAGGMPGSVHIDQGLADEAIAVSFTLGGYEAQAVRQMSVTTVDGVQLRFAGSYQRDDTGETSSVEIVCRGRYSELDRGTKKVGDNTQTKVSMNCSYYKEVLNGETLVEIDLINMVEVINGVDLMAEHRKNIGL